MGASRYQANDSSSIGMGVEVHKTSHPSKIIIATFTTLKKKQNNKIYQFLGTFIESAKKLFENIFVLNLAYMMCTLVDIKQKKVV